MTLYEMMEALNVSPQCTDDEDIANIKLIAEVIEKLPEDIQLEVVPTVKFIAIQAPHATFEKWFCVAHKEDKCMPVIVLNFSGMKRRSVSYKKTTIAHEIAHFILDHDDVIDAPKAEKEADDLSEKWGFGRAYKSYNNIIKT